MVFDWLTREGGLILTWWLLATLAGLAVLPLCWRWLGGLPDSGYAFSKALGIVLTGYLYWILGSLGFLRNTSGGIVLAWTLLLALSVMLYWRGARLDVRAWWRENRSTVMVAEVLFAVAFVAWCVYRAHQNGVNGTEKPMDLMFISGIMRGETLPPGDPWLSGYSISYYYFGYLIAAMFGMVSGVVSTTVFNLWTALLFALAAVTAFGVVNNLARARNVARKNWALAAGVLGAVMIVLMGNFEFIMIELPYQTRTASEAYLRFMAVDERDEYPERTNARAAGIADDQTVNLLAGQSDPMNWGNWWWFRASRVLRDFNLDGTPSGIQPIDEFPQFSFLLADNHPHVMALPFVLLVVGLALNVALGSRAVTWSETILYAVTVGSLVFLNTWDWPIYLALMAGAEGVRRWLRGWLDADWWGVAGLFAKLLVLGIVFYAPFLISFRSQASGIVPNVISPTFLQQYFVMFGPFVLLLALYLGFEARGNGTALNWHWGRLLALGLFIALALMWGAFLLGAALVPDIQANVMNFVQPYGGLGGALPVILQRRLAGLPMLLVLFAAVVVVAARLLARQRQTAVVKREVATGFVLLLIGGGLLLSIVPEFAYLRDNFGVRINTIFKFYYQVWVCFGLASAYAVFILLTEAGRVWRAVAGLVTVLVLGAGLMYPLFGVQSRIFNEGAARTPEGGLTLDGGRKLVGNEDYESIQCFGAIAESGAIVAEALGGAYNNPYPTGRVPGLVGVPVVLGWQNHEAQWRGATYSMVVATRPNDIPTLYQELRWDVVVPIIERYGIDYIFYGASERLTYGSVGEEKFRDVLEPLCQVGDSVFYRVTAAGIAAGKETNQ